MIKILTLLAFYFLHNALVFAAPIATEVILPPTAVDAVGDRSVSATPFDYYKGDVYTVHVEPSDGSGRDGVNLRTVVRKGTRNASGQWSWTSSVVESRTIRDEYHTQASIVVDKLGYIHTAYNMHNMPWQYSVSKNPGDISSWEFRGQAITQSDIEKVKFLNQTSFPQLGSAAIPGNQITYPMFFKDRLGDLYITYRYSLKPAQPWEQRAFAGGIAKYDTTSRSWKSVGGPVEITGFDAQLEPGQLNATQMPFAFQEGYSVYLITLTFDQSNGMHVFWHWRENGAGEKVTRPSYAYSPDVSKFYTSKGASYNLPVNLNTADIVSQVAPVVEYYAQKSADVFIDGKPAVVLNPASGVRTITYLNKTTGMWSPPVVTPWGATEVVVDKAGNQWMFVSGLQVFKRSAALGNWVQVGQIGTALGYPRAQYIPSEDLFIVHAKSSDGANASIVSFKSQ